MRELRYVDGAIVITDALSDALLALSQELAQADTADVVEVPAVVDGTPGYVKLLLGPASQLIDLPASDDIQAADDTDALAEIERLRKKLAPSRPVPEDPSEFGGRPSDEY